MKKAIENQEVNLTESEINYVYTSWKQMYNQAYKNFEDYLKIAIEGKKITGSIYN